jgi:peptide/nickel transport system substrate-binding protein
VKSLHSFVISLRDRIAHLGIRARVAFLFFSILAVVGILGSIITLSNYFTEEVPVTGGTYREGIVGAPRFINPVLANSDADRDATALVYSGLVRKNEYDDVVPDIADHWTVSENEKTYTFILKDQVRFHDGTELTSEDVVFTIKKIQDPLMNSPFRVAFEGVTVTAPDQKTIVFDLEKPYAGFMQQLTIGILPSHLWKDIPYDAWQTSTYNTQAIGTGPYMIDTISRGDSGVPDALTFHSFKKFALGTPFIDHIVLKFYPNSRAAFSALEGHEIDGLTNIEPHYLTPALLKDFTLQEQALPRVFNILLNVQKNAIFADKNVVKALNLAVNKEDIIKNLFAGYGTGVQGPLPSSEETTPAPYEERVRIASELLDKAGWKRNPDTGIREKISTTTTTVGKKTTSQSSKKTLSFTLVTANTPDLETSARMIQKNYQDLGVLVEVKVFEIGNFYEHSIRDRDFEALLFGQVIKHDTDIFAFWHSSQKNSPGLNITGYTNKTVDQLLEQAIKESDAEKRFALYDKITTELQKDAPVVFLYTPENITLRDPALHHVVTPSGTMTSDRFAQIATWYLYTDHVWHLFTH